VWDQCHALSGQCQHGHVIPKLLLLFRSSSCSLCRLLNLLLHPQSSNQQRQHWYLSNMCGGVTVLAMWFSVCCALHLNAFPNWSEASLSVSFFRTEQVSFHRQQLHDLQHAAWQMTTLSSRRRPTMSNRVIWCRFYASKSVVIHVANFLSRSWSFFWGNICAPFFLERVALQWMETLEFTKLISVLSFSFRALNHVQKELFG